MAPDSFQLHHRSEVLLAIDAARLSTHLDDHRRLASHMEKPSLMTAGASTRIDTDESQGQADGSVIRMTGRVLGLRLSVEECVTRRDPLREKVWETVGTETRLVVFIDHRLLARGISQVLCWLLGGPYAAWCARRMAGDARAAFGTIGTR